MIVFLLSLSTLVAIATVLPVLKNEIWWIRCWDFPRLQLFILASVLLGLTLWFVDIKSVLAIILILVNGFCAIYQGIWILPYRNP